MTEHDTGDEDRRDAEDLSVCPMCGGDLHTKPRRPFDYWKSPRYDARLVVFPLPLRSADIPREGISMAMCTTIRVHNDIVCVEQAQQFIDAQHYRARRDPFWFPL